MTIAESVNTIGENAFRGCFNVAEIIVPQSVTSIGASSFANCSILNSITLPDGITVIEPYLFVNCYALRNFTIPSNVTHIWESAFKNSGLHSITIPNKVEVIGNNAFYKCEQLESVHLPGSVQRIGSDAFGGCSSLRTIDIPGSVTSIGEYAFSKSGLKSVTIPGGVWTVNNWTFTGCKNLESVYLSEGVRELGINTFSECPNLTSITIPRSVNDFGLAAFAQSPNIVIYGYRGSLAEEYAAGNGIPFVDLDALPIQTTENGLSYTKDNQNTTIVGYTGSETSLVIPDKIDGLPVTGIDSGAFTESPLTWLIIPPGVETIGEGIFADTSTIIYGEPSSAAQAYAEKHGLRFGDVNQPALLPGDANDDGVVNVSDLESIIDHLVSGIPCASKDNADANGDKAVDVQDILWVIDQMIVD